jgi:hypothetical protein
MTFHAAQVFALSEDLRGVELSAAEPQPTSREGSIMAAPPRVVSHQS